jgi:N-acetylglutamate synthase-like GNAT family acetyltransferase
MTAPNTALPLPLRIAETGDVEMGRRLVVHAWGDDAIIILGRPHRVAEMTLLAATDPDGKLLGMAYYRLNNATALLGAIVICPDATSHRGIGGALFDAVRDVARAAGMKKLRACTTNDNFEAMRFYQKRGLRFETLYPRVADAFRAFRPGLRLEGEHGIPRRDILELEMDL